jgi:hypothetical protein
MTITHPDTCRPARKHALACSLCGRAIHAAPFAREGDQFYCEASFRKQREPQDLQEERDQAYLALAEALAAHSATRKKPCVKWWR